MKLKKLSIQGCRSFDQKQTIDFDTSGLVLIQGLSGSGKSTIFYAISFVLNFLPDEMTAKDLQNIKPGASKLQVDLEFEFEGVRYEIGRGAKTYLKFQSEALEGAVVVNKRLAQIFGVGPDLLRVLTFRPQRAGSLILGCDAAELLGFFGELLKLEQIEKAVDLTKEQLKSLTKSEQQLRSTIEARTSVKSTISVLPQSTFDEMVDLKNQSQGLVAELETQISAAELEAKQQNEAFAVAKTKPTEFDALKAQAQQFIASLKEKDIEARGDCDNHNAQLDDKILELRQTERDAKALVVDKPNVEAALRACLATRCPTCSQPWHGAEMAIDGHRERLSAIEEAIANAPILAKSIADLALERRVFAPNPQIAQFETVVSDLGAQSRAAIESMRPDLSGVVATIGALRARQNQTAELIREADLAIQSHTQNKATIDAMDAAIKTAQSELEPVLEQIQIESDFVSVVGKTGFLGSIFEEVLQEVAVETNRRLTNIRNLAGVTFGLRSETVTSKGIPKKSITPFVVIAGQETKVSLLSGGMLSALELVTDLALKNVIERRTGLKLSFYFIDEAFDGLDAPSYEALLEVVQQESVGRDVFVIDHKNEFKELFKKTIDVKMVNGVSCFQQSAP